MASRLPAFRSRAIVPFVRYSTGSAPPEPATSSPLNTPPTNPAPTESQTTPAASATDSTPSADSSDSTTSNTTPPWATQEQAKQDTIATRAAPKAYPPSRLKTHKASPAPRTRSKFAAKAPYLNAVPQANAGSTSDAPTDAPTTAARPHLQPPKYMPTLSTKPPQPSNSNMTPEIALWKPLRRKQTFEKSSGSKPGTEASDADLSHLDINWETSFFGAGTKPVTDEQFDILAQPLRAEDIEVKPDGVLYLPEIKYRRRLNEAFGPMGWSLIPRGEPVVGDTIVTREYALIVNGR